MRLRLAAKLPESEHSKFLESYSNSEYFRKLLIKELESKLKTAQETRGSVKGYDCPSWAYKQADTNGYERALQEALDLLTPVVREQ